MEPSEIISKATDFLQRSSSYYKLTQNRMSDDISFYSGDVWTEDLIKTYNRKKRTKELFNIQKLYVNAVASPYSSSPWHTELVKADTTDLQGVQDRVDKFEAQEDVKIEIQEWLTNTCIAGQGFSVMSFENSDIPDDPFAKPILEIIDDPSQVAFDPSVMTTNGEDAEEGAVVNYISLNKAKRIYGEDVVPMGYPSTLPMICDAGDQWKTKPGMIQEVMYYWIGEGGYCEFAKICGQKVVKSGRLNIKHIPIMRMTGYKIRNTEKHTDYIGIVNATKSLQIAAHLGFSTLMERMGRSTKAGFLMPVGAMEGLEEYIQRMSDPDSAVVMYNGTIAPTPIKEEFATADLRDTISQATTLMSQVLGIPMTGIEGLQSIQKTATQVALEQSNCESNVSCFYVSAMKALHLMGQILLENWNAGGATFKLTNGPDVISRGMKQRNILNAIAQFCPESMRGILAVHMADTIPDLYSKNLKKDLIANLPPELKLVAGTDVDPNAAHILNGMQDTINKAMEALAQEKQKNQEMEKQVQLLSLQLANTKAQQEIDVQKTALEFQLKNKELDLKAAESGAKIESDAAAKSEEIKLGYQKLIEESKNKQKELDAKTVEAISKITGGKPYEVQPN